MSSSLPKFLEDGMDIDFPFLGDGSVPNSALNPPSGENEETCGEGTAAQPIVLDESEDEVLSVCHTAIWTLNVTNLSLGDGRKGCAGSTFEEVHDIPELAY